MDEYIEQIAGHLSAELPLVFDRDRVEFRPPRCSAPDEDGDDEEQCDAA